jgi:hypothetical protein
LTVPSRPAVTSWRERAHQCSEHTPPPEVPDDEEPEPELELPCALKATGWRNTHKKDFVAHREMDN